MDQVKLALGVSFGDDLVRELQAASPRLQVLPLGDLVYREVQLVRQAPGSPEQRQVSAELDAAFRDAEVLLSSWRLPENVPARTPRLRWVQGMGAGMELILEALPPRCDIVLTNARGVVARPIAEWMLGAMLMFAKHIPVYSRQKLERRYQRHERQGFSLDGKTVGILGLGGIGGETATLAKALGMRVLATRRSLDGPAHPSVAQLLPPSRTAELLGASDFVAVALPLTRETFHFVGEPQLRAMKPTAYIMNVGRGPLIDEVALVRALKERWIAGAALDVFEQEPLPRDSELWGLDNVILTPHISGAADDYDRRLVALFKKNLRRYLAGEPLLNVVDKVRGY